MNTKFKITIAFALALLFGAKAIGQEWEYVRTFQSDESLIPNLMQSMTELESGDIIVNASWKDKNVNGTVSENPGIMKFSAEGE